MGAISAPADKPRKIEAPPQLTDALSSKPEDTSRCREDYLTIFADEEAVSSLAPDMDALCKLPLPGVIASAPGNRADFVSRYFVPQQGIPEDPVSGSTHTALIPYWSNRLAKRDLQARQISKRGGDLTCKHIGERVEIGGNAVTYLVGQISI